MLYISGIIGLELGCRETRFFGLFHYSLVLDDILSATKYYFFI